MGGKYNFFVCTFYTLAIILKNIIHFFIFKAKSLSLPFKI